MVTPAFQLRIDRLAAHVLPLLGVVLNQRGSHHAAFLFGNSGMHRGLDAAVAVTGATGLADGRQRGCQQYLVAAGGDGSNGRGELPVAFSLLAMMTGASVALPTS